MSTKKDVIEDLIKDVIDYLADVYKGKKIGGKSQGFFVSSEELDKMLNKYFIFFKNRNELINDVKYNYSLIKDFSFPNEKGDFIYVKDLSNEKHFCSTNGHFFANLKFPLCLHKKLG
jgi:hypothetical protein